MIARGLASLTRDGYEDDPMNFFYPCRLIGLMALVIGVMSGCGPNLSSATQPSGRPTAEPAAEKPPMLRRIEIPLLGKVSDINGMPPWPQDAQRWRSWSVEEPCDVTLTFPSGRTLNIKTRPILIVSRDNDVVVAVQAPLLDTESSWIAAQARRIDKLLTEWRAAPSHRMRGLISEFKRIPLPKPNDPIPQAGIERVGFARLDERSSVTFEMVIVRPGQWNLVAVFEAGEEVRKRNQNEALIERQIEAGGK